MWKTNGLQNGLLHSVVVLQILKDADSSVSLAFEKVLVCFYQKRH